MSQPYAPIYVSQLWHLTLTPEFLVYDSEKFGQFSFRPIAVHTDRLLELVQRIQITQLTMGA